VSDGSRSLLLMSGGMDSACLAYWLRPSLALTVNYGQRAAVGEIRASRTICDALGIQHECLTLECGALGSGDMAESGKPLPCAQSSDWWPFRNQLLITLGGMRALALGLDQLYIGSVATDSTHVDGTPAFYSAMAALLRLQEGSLEIEAPALAVGTAELVRRTGIPRELLAWTHSCHTNEFACGNCRGCYKHREVLEELGSGL